MTRVGRESEVSSDKAELFHSVCVDRRTNARVAEERGDALGQLPQLCGPAQAELGEARERLQRLRIPSQAPPRPVSAARKRTGAGGRGDPTLLMTNSCSSASASVMTGRINICSCRLPTNMPTPTMASKKASLDAPDRRGQRALRNERAHQRGAYRSCQSGLFR